MAARRQSADHIALSAITEVLSVASWQQEDSPDSVGFRLPCRAIHTNLDGPAEHKSMIINNLQSKLRGMRVVPLLDCAPQESQSWRHRP
jgi:hypothetical protein